MKNLVIIGAGTAGTMMANHLFRKLNCNEWKIIIIDKHSSHYYQPGFLFIPFGIYSERDVIKKKESFIPKECTFILEGIEVIVPDKNKIKLENGTTVNYDILIVATGAKIFPEEVDGLTESGWRENIFDFYTIEGAVALRDALQKLKGGKVVVHLTEMPIKCPVAPLEFTFLLDWYLAKMGVRKEIELTYVTPLDGAFTKQNCSLVLGHLLKDKNISLITEFELDRVEPNKLISYEEKSVDFDFLVSIPTNMGDRLIERSEMGDDVNFIPTNKHTLQSKKHDNIFIIGDATDLPASKAGSVAHFQSDVLTENIQLFIKGKELKADFDGHANCFIESGYDKAFLIDFNYDIEPVEGTFPLPVIGPFSLLKETKLNHLGKMAFKWIYWNVMLKGLPMPGISTQMTRMGKKL